MLALLPIWPPIPTAIKSGITNVQRTETCSADIWPAKPATELTKIKKLAVAAMTLALSHLIRYNNGAKKIPPPIPTRPETNPMTAPIAPFRTRLDDLGVFMVGIRMSMRMPAMSKLIANNAKNGVLVKAMEPPIKAIGTLVTTNGSALRRERTLFFIKR